MRDPNDCTCPGARLVGVTEVDGKRVEAWECNDPTVKCRVHPYGYDLRTGKHAGPPAKEK